MSVLEDLPSFKPPLDYLLELLPKLQARYYSISSSPKVSVCVCPMQGQVSSGYMYSTCWLGLELELHCVVDNFWIILLCLAFLLYVLRQYSGAWCHQCPPPLS